MPIEIMSATCSQTTQRRPTRFNTRTTHYVSMRLPAVSCACRHQALQMGRSRRDLLIKTPLTQNPVDHSSASLVPPSCTYHDTLLHSRLAMLPTCHLACSSDHWRHSMATFEDKWCAPWLERKTNASAQNDAHISVEKPPDQIASSWEG